MKKVLNILSCLVIILCISGCGRRTEEEEFKAEYTLSDGQMIKFAYNPQYNETTVLDALSKGDLTVDAFISNLTYVSIMKDGGSKIYKHDGKKNNNIYGSSAFYVVKCDTLDGVRDIYVARYEESVLYKCQSNDE